MKEALKESLKAEEKGEVPIGAVVVWDGKIISRAHNLRERNFDPCGHAEFLAIQKAARKKKNWRLDQATVYVTVEPCVMCAGIILQSRIKRLCFGCRDPKAGAVVSLYQILQDKRLNHQVEIEEGCEMSECSEIMQTFFDRLRQKWRDVRVVEGARLESV